MTLETIAIGNKSIIRPFGRFSNFVYVASPIYWLCTCMCAVHVDRGFSVIYVNRFPNYDLSVYFLFVFITYAIRTRRHAVSVDL